MFLYLDFVFSSELNGSWYFADQEPEHDQICLLEIVFLFVSRWEPGDSTATRRSEVIDYDNFTSREHRHRQIISDMFSCIP